MIFSVLAFLTATDVAHAADAPVLASNHASCYRSVFNTDDLFCLTRYSLPTYETATPPPVSPEAWCAQLVDRTGCTDDPVEPSAPTSLPQGRAVLALYDGCSGDDCSAATLAGVARVPRIGFALGGVYLTAGHTLAWADPDVAVCIESDPGDFDTFEQDCTPESWSSAANDQTAQRQQLGADMVEQVITLGIEQARPLNLYVNLGSQLITTAGKVFALEALPGADRILGVFASGSGSTGIGPTPTPGQTAIEAEIATDAATVQTRLAEFGETHGTGSGEQTGLIISVVIAVVIFLGSLALTRGSIVFASFGTMCFLPVLTALGVLPFEALAVMIAVLALPAGVTVVRKFVGQAGG